MRLPAAPPMISASPIARQQLMVRAGSPRRWPTPTSAAVAMTAMTHRLEREVDAVQHAERRAGVPDVREIDEARE